MHRRISLGLFRSKKSNYNFCRVEVLLNSLRKVENEYQLASGGDLKIEISIYNNAN